MLILQIQDIHMVKLQVACLFVVILTVSEPAAVTNSCNALTDKAWKQFDKQHRLDVKNDFNFL